MRAPSRLTYDVQSAFIDLLVAQESLALARDNLATVIVGGLISTLVLTLAAMPMLYYLARPSPKGTVTTVPR